MRLSAATLYTFADAAKYRKTFEQRMKMLFVHARYYTRVHNTMFTVERRGLARHFSLALSSLFAARRHDLFY